MTKLDISNHAALVHLFNGDSMEMFSSQSAVCRHLFHVFRSIQPLLNSDVPLVNWVLLQRLMGTLLHHFDCIKQDTDQDTGKPEEIISGVPSMFKGKKNRIS
jgi:hypothetical protein